MAGSAWTQATVTGSRIAVTLRRGPARGGRAEPRGDDEIGGTRALGVTRDGGDERVAGQRVGVDSGPRPHGRGAWHGGQQGDLAEEVARPEQDGLATIRLDLDLAAGDHIEVVALLAAPEHDAVGRQLYLLEGRGERLDDGGRQWREERNSTQERERGRVGPPRVECGELAPGQRGQHREQ